MNYQDKMYQLQDVIKQSLKDLIDRDYYLLEVPYYTNIGDTLIWQGELDFLKSLPYKCLGMHSLETFSELKHPERSLILFQGGGNFGDLWTKHHDFKMNIIQNYPNNKFIFFPQTVYFQKEANLKKCADFLSKYTNIVICARDNTSYDILSKNFSNKILLVPDMAFCIDMKKWNREYNKKNDKKNDLLLKRIDAEFKESDYITNLCKRNDIDITDWPTMYSKDIQTRIMLRLRDSRKMPKWIADKFVYYYYRKYLINTGIKLLCSHDKIYTTRLHAAILGVLWGKEITFLDNSYGKNKTFYDSWLSDCDCINFIK